MENCSRLEDFSSCDSESSCSPERQQHGLFLKKNLFQGNGDFDQAMYCNQHSHHECHDNGGTLEKGLGNRDPNYHEGKHNYLMHHGRQCDNYLHHKRCYDPDMHQDKVYGNYIHHVRGYGHHRDHELGHNYSTERGRRHDYHGHHERGHSRYVPYERRHGCHMTYERRHDHHFRHERGHGHHLHHEREHGHHLHHEREHGHHLHHEREHHHLYRQRGHGNNKRDHIHHLHSERELNDRMNDERQHGCIEHHVRDHGDSADQQKQGAFLYHSLEDHFIQNKFDHVPSMRYERKFLGSVRHKRRYDHHMRYKMGHGKRRFPSFFDQEVCRKNNLCNEGSSKVYDPKSKVKIANKDAKFQICLDTSHYQPEEVKMKNVNGRIEVCAVHESFGDDVYEFHEMCRSFTLPAGVDSEKVSSHLAADGTFIIEAFINSSNEAETEKDVTVVHSNE